MMQEQRKIAEVLYELGMDPRLIAVMTNSQDEIDDDEESKWAGNEIIMFSRYRCFTGFSFAHFAMKIT